jgi:hypothetical protein
MKTDDLISSLSERLEPTSPRAPLWGMALWVAGGLAVSTLLMLTVLGLRPDFMTAMGTGMFWTKFTYTLALGAVGLWLAERLGRPGATVGRPARMLQSLVVGFIVLAAIRYFTAPAADHTRMLMGHSARVCPCSILALSAPLLLATLLAMRRLAPTNPTLTGFASGLAAGGMAAFVYAFSCNESAMPFVAAWYTLPVLVCGVVGAAIGRFALRW